MPAQTAFTDTQIKDLILKILDENRALALATLRPDGWPQATIVGFVHDDLTLYVAVARESQKFKNIGRDGRVSVAIGLHAEGSGSVRGLSMAAHADEVVRPDEVARVNDLIWSRYPEVAVFAPREANSAVLRIMPELVSVVDDGVGLRIPMLLNVSCRTVLSPS
jgi:nitroimidazol reductase NimA-like FMN-containing flavoprotein (pyridoxamine 5'-phosphate oxidase superfamily)